MFLPAYSCTLNPIEHLWNVVKNRWRRTQERFVNPFHSKEERQQLSLARLRSIVNEMEPEMVKRIAGSNREVLVRALRGEMV